MLSICIIVKNEENYLENCINSVITIADEIILVDTGSTDNTINIGQKYTNNIYSFVWTGDFSLARNYSLSKANGDFIFIIDADEVIINPEQIKNFINTSSSKIGGYLVNIQSIVNGKNGKEYLNSAQIRLIRNNRLFKFEGFIHEQIANSISNAGYVIENSNISLKHFGYDLSESQKKLKHKRNIELIEKSMKIRTTNELKFYKAKELAGIDDFYLAINILQEIIVSEKSNLALLIAALNFASFLSYKINDIEISLNLISLSLELSPNQAFANFVRAEIKSEMKEYQEALVYYRAAYFSSQNVNYLAIGYGEYSIPHEVLKLKSAKLLLILKRYSEAISEYESILKINPKNKTASIGLANAYFNFKNPTKTKQILLELSGKYPDDKEIKAYIYQSGLFIDDLSKIGDILTFKPLLTLSMIVKNEEKNLRECIESAFSIVDEIVIVDTGSTDKTKEIAKSFGAKIIDYEWKNNFADARNEALKYSTGEWILYLDADERLQNLSKTEMEHLFSKVPDNIGGFLCIIESEHSKENGGTEMHRGGYPRIFKNYGYPQIQFTGRIHEQITPSIKALGKSFTNSGIVITHLGYNLTPEEMSEKVKRNYEMLITQVAEEPLNGYAWFQLGQTLGRMNLLDQSIEAFQFAISTKSLSDSILASAYSALAQMVGNKKQFEETLSYSEKSLKLAPDQLYANHLKGFALLYLGKFEEAENIFLRVLELKKRKKNLPLSGFDIEIPENLILDGLAKARKKENII
jgi:glycosyltransferase involved in cell wall biosynthesis